MSFVDSCDTRSAFSKIKPQHNSFKSASLHMTQSAAKLVSDADRAYRMSPGLAHRIHVPNLNSDNQVGLENSLSNVKDYNSTLTEASDLLNPNKDSVDNTISADNLSSNEYLEKAEELSRRSRIAHIDSLYMRKIEQEMMISYEETDDIFNAKQYKNTADDYDEVDQEIVKAFESSNCDSIENKEKEDSIHKNMNDLNIRPDRNNTEDLNPVCKIDGLKSIIGMLDTVESDSDAEIGSKKTPRVVANTFGVRFLPAVNDGLSSGDSEDEKSSPTQFDSTEMKFKKLTEENTSENSLISEHSNDIINLSILKTNFVNNIDTVDKSLDNFKEKINEDLKSMQTQASFTHENNNNKKSPIEIENNCVPDMESATILNISNSVISQNDCLHKTNSLEFAPILAETNIHTEKLNNSKDMSSNEVDCTRHTENNYVFNEKDQARLNVELAIREIQTAVLNSRKLHAPVANLPQMTADIPAPPIWIARSDTDSDPIATNSSRALTDLFVNVPNMSPQNKVDESPSDNEEKVLLASAISKEQNSSKANQNKEYEYGLEFMELKSNSQKASYEAMQTLIKMNNKLPSQISPQINSITFNVSSENPSRSTRKNENIYNSNFVDVGEIRKIVKNKNLPVSHIGVHVTNPFKKIIINQQSLQNSLKNINPHEEQLSKVEQILENNLTPVININKNIEDTSRVENALYNFSASVSRQSNLNESLNIIQADRNVIKSNDFTNRDKSKFDVKISEINGTNLKKYLKTQQIENSNTNLSQNGLQINNEKNILNKFSTAEHNTKNNATPLQLSNSQSKSINKNTGSINMNAQHLPIDINIANSNYDNSQFANYDIEDVGHEHRNDNSYKIMNVKRDAERILGIGKQKLFKGKVSNNQSYHLGNISEEDISSCEDETMQYHHNSSDDEIHQYEKESCGSNSSCDDGQQCQNDACECCMDLYDVEMGSRQVHQSCLLNQGGQGINKEYSTDDETEELLTKQYASLDNNTQPLPQPSQCDHMRARAREVIIRDPSNDAVLIEGVLFRASYLGSTQLISEGQPNKNIRMMQAQEAVGRIKASDGENQPSTEVDLFVSVEKIMVLNTNLQEIMMDHSLRTISYIADIGDILVIMARRGSIQTKNSRKTQTKICCHLFESDEAQLIAQSIGQAFHVAYLEFLKANGVEEQPGLNLVDYQDVLNQQEIFGQELYLFSNKEMQKEVIISKAKGEILGVVIVESGWGSMVPTVIVANLLGCGAAARSNQLNIGDQIITINNVSLVGLPLSTCQNYIKACRNQCLVKLVVVSCPPVVEVLIKRPDIKYQLGFSVQSGVICSLLRGGIAERGGVRVGHRIIEINGQSVVAVPHERIVNMLATSVGEINMKTMPTSIFRLLTGQKTPNFI